MNISLTAGARAFLAHKGAGTITVASLIFSSCCSGPLPPEVKPGAPSDTTGFDVYGSSDVQVYFDSLLDPRPELIVDVKNYGNYSELFIQGWD